MPILTSSAHHSSRQPRRSAPISRVRNTATGSSFVRIAELEREFQFTLDSAALPDNAKCQRYFTPGQDGLKQRWKGTCWMNPPYGYAFGKWVKKTRESAQAGAIVV